jgi:hypothetical protein
MRADGIKLFESGKEVGLIKRENGQWIYLPVRQAIAHHLWFAASSSVPRARVLHRDRLDK